MNWVFQLNPKTYRAMDAIMARDTLIMSVNQYKKQIKANHRAYIWLAGANGGLAARGTILDDPKERMRDLDDPFVINAALHSGKHLSVEIRLEDKLPDLAIKRAVLLGDERLRGIAFLRFANATNFALTDGQARTLDDLIDGRYMRVPARAEESPESEKPTQRVWIYAPGDDARLWDECVRKRIMSLGWDELGDLRAYTDKEAMLGGLLASGAGGKNAAHACWQFAHDVAPGDIVYAKKGLTQLVGRGVVRSEYRFDASRAEYRSVRTVDWTNNAVVSLTNDQLPMKALTDITNRLDYQQKFDKLFEIEREEPEAGSIWQG